MSYAKLREACETVVALLNSPMHATTTAQGDVCRFLTQAMAAEPDTCKTCGWWGADSGRVWNPSKHRTCRNTIKLGHGVKDVGTLFQSSYLDIGITTGPDFGCRHHKEKGG